MLRRLLQAMYDLDDRMMAGGRAEDREQLAHRVADARRFLEEGETLQAAALAQVSRWPLLATYFARGGEGMFEHLVMLTDRRLVLVKPVFGRDRVDRVVFARPLPELTVVEHVPKEFGAWGHLDVRSRDGVMQRMRFAGWERETAAILRALRR